ncbi:hypothetical protein IPF89_05615 [Candidatus Saccharibacteria bacterium]|nr:MAG: hypothetical protein IPF89_05615 [Candidatus Saccharibacteria bacterium]
MFSTKHTTINHWLRDAAEQLADIGITSALLDAEIILSHTLRKSRTFCTPMHMISSLCENSISPMHALTFGSIAHRLPTLLAIRSFTEDYLK